MLTAFVSMSVTPGADEEIVKEILKDGLVKEAWLTTGEYDVLLILRGQDAEEINDFVNNRIRTHEGVVRAVVAFGIESMTSDN